MNNNFFLYRFVWMWTDRRLWSISLVRSSQHCRLTGRVRRCLDVVWWELDLVSNRRVLWLQVTAAQRALEMASLLMQWTTSLPTCCWTSPGDCQSDLTIWWMATLGYAVALFAEWCQSGMIQQETHSYHGHHITVHAVKYESRNNYSMWHHCRFWRATHDCVLYSCNWLRTLYTLCPQKNKANYFFSIVSSNATKCS